jgi:hypothetical protein
MPERRCKKREKGWAQKKMCQIERIQTAGRQREATYCVAAFLGFVSPAKIKYEQFHRAVGRLPRGRAVITML